MNVTPNIEFDLWQGEPGVEGSIFLGTHQARQLKPLIAIGEGQEILFMGNIFFYRWLILPGPQLAREVQHLAEPLLFARVASPDYPDAMLYYLVMTQHVMNPDGTVNYIYTILNSWPVPGTRFSRREPNGLLFT